MTTRIAEIMLCEHHTQHYLCSSNAVVFAMTSTVQSSRACETMQCMDPAEYVPLTFDAAQNSEENDSLHHAMYDGGFYIVARNARISTRNYTTVITRDFTCYPTTAKVSLQYTLSPVMDANVTAEGQSSELRTAEDRRAYPSVQEQVCWTLSAHPPILSGSELKWFSATATWPDKFSSEKVNLRPAMLVARVLIIQRRSRLGLQKRLRWAATNRYALLPTAGGGGGP